MNWREYDEMIRSGKSVSVPPAIADWLAKPKANFIGGKWEDGPNQFSTLAPATGEVLSQVSSASEAQVSRAVENGRVAFAQGDWRDRPLRERAAVLRLIADRIDAHRLPLAVLESLDTGKPIRESLDGDIPRAALNFRFFADFAEAQPDHDDFIQPGSRHRCWREPLGVAALITPWNLPLYLESWKLAPALLMGNSCILKPSELTPLTATYLFELLAEVGLPDGVVQLLHGFGENSTGAWLTGQRGLSAISFTGETGTGRAIMRAAAGGPTRVSFELGGKGASVVFADADISAAVDETLRAAFRNQGEICLACPRIFVEASRFGEFLERFTEQAKRIRLGNPLDWQTEMGAVISADHQQKIHGFLREAAGPISVECGGLGAAVPEKGYFVAPTVLTRVPDSNRLSQEEIFGPVALLYSFESETEVIRRVNDTPYGLSASVWTSDRNQAERVARQIAAGLIWWNAWFVRDLRTPFGGQKRSGLGREGGVHSLDFFSEWKSFGHRETTGT